MLELSTTTTRLTRRLTDVSRLLAALILVLLALSPAHADAAERYRTVDVDDPYLEMHTGPGRGYPKFYVVERGESIDIIKRRTDWFLVRSPNGKEGWVDRRQMERTLQPDGDPLDFSASDQVDFTYWRATSAVPTLSRSTALTHSTRTWASSFGARRSWAISRTAGWAA